MGTPGQSRTERRLTAILTADIAARVVCDRVQRRLHFQGQADMERVGWNPQTDCYGFSCIAAGGVGERIR